MLNGMGIAGVTLALAMMLMLMLPRRTLRLSLAVAHELRLRFVDRALLSSVSLLSSRAGR